MAHVTYLDYLKEVILKNNFAGGKTELRESWYPRRPQWLWRDIVLETSCIGVGWDSGSGGLQR